MPLPSIVGGGGILNPYVPPHEPGMLRASKWHHHDFSLRHDVGALSSVPDHVPLTLATVADTSRVDHLGVVRWNATSNTHINKSNNVIYASVLQSCVGYRPVDRLIFRATLYTMEDNFNAIQCLPSRRLKQSTVNVNWLCIYNRFKQWVPETDYPVAEEVTEILHPRFFSFNDYPACSLVGLTAVEVFSPP